MTHYNELIAATSGQAALLLDHLGDTLPIDPFQVCEHLDIEVMKRPSLCMRPDAFHVYYRGRDYVVLNTCAHIPVPRQRFSLLHETCEALICRARRNGDVELHQHEVRRNGLWLVEYERPCADIICAVCDHWAGMMLMPPEPFAKLWRDYSHKPGKQREAIVANKCFVSIAAVRVRASHLGLAHPSNADEEGQPFRVSNEVGEA